MTTTNFSAMGALLDGINTNYKIAIAIVFGIALGFLLVKAKLCFRSAMLRGLSFRGPVALTLLWGLFFGTLFFIGGSAAGMFNDSIRFSFLKAAILGGILCGLGTALCGFTPITAIAGFATGRLYVLWTLIGMITAIPIMHAISGWVEETLNLTHSEILEVVPISWELRWNNPLWWILGGNLLLCLFLHAVQSIVHRASERNAATSGVPPAEAPPEQ